MMNKTKNNIVNLHNVTTKAWSFSSAIQREEYCPVREKYVTEYQVPIETIERDDRSQNRDTDSPPNKVSEISNSFQTTGQNEGICIEDFNTPNKKFAVRWGNTRFRAAKQLSEEVLPYNLIKNCEEGMIWASKYKEPKTELRRLQAKENNRHRPNTPANAEDNVRSMQDIISDGLLDDTVNGVFSRYEDQEDAEKRVRVKKEVERTMPSFAGKKFKGFWSKFRKKTASSFKVKSYGLKDMQNYFIKHNPFGITDMKEAKKTINKYVFLVDKDIDGNSIEPENIYIAFANGGVHKGAIIQGCMAAKHVDEAAVKTYIVSTVSPATSAALAKARTADCGKMRYWNSKLPQKEPFDAAFYLPQTEPECSSSESWARVKKF